MPTRASLVVCFSLACPLLLACDSTPGQLATDGAIDQLVKKDFTKERAWQDSNLLPVQGRILLSEIGDVRVNMPAQPRVQIEFAEQFYDAAFAPTSSFGQCAFGQEVPPPPGVPHWVDGGPVTITGGDLTLSYAFDPSGPYLGNLAAGGGSIFSDGQTLSISGPGSSQVPGGIAGTLPAPADLFQTFSYSVPVASDFTVQWKKSTAEQVRVVIYCTGQNAEGYRVVCTSTDTGSAVVPSAALAALAAKCKTPDIDVERITRTTLGSPFITAQATIRWTAGLELK